MRSRPATWRLQPRSRGRGRGRRGELQWAGPVCMWRQAVGAMHVFPSPAMQHPPAAPDHLQDHIDLTAAPLPRAGCSASPAVRPHPCGCSSRWWRRRRRRRRGRMATCTAAGGAGGTASENSEVRTACGFMRKDSARHGWSGPHLLRFTPRLSQVLLAAASAAASAEGADSWVPTAGRGAAGAGGSRVWDRAGAAPLDTIRSAPLADSRCRLQGELTSSSCSCCSSQ